MNPKLVIAMGAWNEERYLRETLPAISRQSFPEFAVLALDNGSTDATWRMLCDHAAHDARFTLIHVRRNLEPAEAMHLGMDMIGNLWPAVPWVVCHGADDIMDADYLEALWSAHEQHPEANYLYSPHRYIDHPEKGVRHYFPYDPNNCCGPDVPFPHWSMFHRSLWDAVGGFDRNIRIGADWDFWRRCSVQDILKPHQLPEPHLNLRIRTDRPSQSSEVDWHRLHAHLKRHRYNDWAKWE